MMKKFEFLEHMADAYIAAYGKDLAEAFENAALAMFETMTDTAKVEPKVEDEIEVEGFDEQSLLYNWLESLIVKFEITGNLYSKFKITAIERTDDGFRLRAKVWGEPFNLEKHPQKVGIKAVTYHMMEVKKETGKVTVKFLLDL
ncbi:MAG TPA: archease [Candidatus Bathyarchaeota archaeon]|nr:archease [Candidatus Bathyarchaeota archaeon]